MPNVKTDFAVGGEKEYREAISKINSGLKVLNSEMNLTKATYADNAKGVEALTAKQDVLERKISSQKEKVETLRKALQASAEKYGESSSKTMQWQTSLNNAEAELQNMTHELAANQEELDKAGEKTGGLHGKLGGLGDMLQSVAGKFGIELPRGAQKAVDGLNKVNAGSALAVTGLGLLAAAVVKVEKALISATLKAAETADEIATLSMTTGLSTQTLQEYSYASELLDVSIDTISGSLTKLTNNMQTAQSGTGAAAEALQALGVQIETSDGQLRRAEDVFHDVIDALGEVQNQTERDALAMDLFGKSAQDLNPLILQGSARFRELAAQAHEAGAVLDDVALNKLTGVDDAMQELKQQVEASKKQVLVEFAPELTAALKDVRGLVKDVGTEMKDSGVVTAFGSLLESVTAMIPKTDTLKGGLSGLALVLAGIADTIDVIVNGVRVIGNFNIKGFTSGGFSSAVSDLKTSLGLNYSSGQGNHYQTVADAQKNASAVRNSGYYKSPETGKYYNSLDHYLQEEKWKPVSDYWDFESWKHVNGYNAGGTPNWRGGSTVVGENGPERVWLPQGAAIQTAQETRQTGGDVYNITIDASNVKEFNDIIRLAQSQRRLARMGAI